MTSMPAVEDLRLADAIFRHGSLGAAAREIHISQPAASQRLSVLERKVGHRLFERDTTGARATDVGREFRRRAVHILEHLDEIVTQTRLAAAEQVMSIGCFDSLARLLFPALDVLLPHITVDAYTNHGEVLVSRVAEGSLDAAYVAVADQLALPRHLVATPIGHDRFVCLVPDGVTPPRAGRRPFSHATVVLYTVNMRFTELADGLAQGGARVRRGPGAEAAIRSARRLGDLCVLPKCLAQVYAEPSERLLPYRPGGRITFFEVCRTPLPTELALIRNELRTEIGLDPAR